MKRVNYVKFSNLPFDFQYFLKNPCEVLGNRNLVQATCQNIKKQSLYLR